MRSSTRRTLFDLLLIAAWFFAMGSSFFFVMWLYPQVIFIETILWVLVAGLSIWFLHKENHIVIFKDSLARSWFLLPFVVFSGLSIFWSVYWQISLSRWLILVCTITSAGFIGIEYKPKELLEKLAGFGILILFLSVLFVVFVPRFGIMNYHIILGAWKGIFWHKNHMGFIAAFFNILFLIKLIESLQSRQGSWILWTACFLGSLIILYQSDSVGAWMTTIFLYGVVLLAILFLKFRTRIRKSHYLVLIGVVLIVVLILAMNLDSFFGLFNRNTTLTGRIPMWTYVFNTYVQKQPLFGYGFNAFWYIKAHRVAIQNAAGYPDQIVIADNGFIDMIVNTGYIGLVLFLLFYCGAWWVSIKYAWRASNLIGFVPVILMIFSLVANISWSLLYENESFLMLTILSFLFCISAMKKEIQR